MASGPLLMLTFLSHSRFFKPPGHHRLEHAVTGDSSIATIMPSGYATQREGEQAVQRKTPPPPRSSSELLSPTSQRRYLNPTWPGFKRTETEVKLDPNHLLYSTALWLPHSGYSQQLARCGAGGCDASPSCAGSRRGSPQVLGRPRSGFCGARRRRSAREPACSASLRPRVRAPPPQTAIR